MSLYIKLDSEIMKCCEDYKKYRIDSLKLSNMLEHYSDQIDSLETRELENALDAVKYQYDLIFWYPYDIDEQPEVTGNIENEVREELLPYVEKIEKLIIRGTVDGNPITKEERAEWWKQQKKRERQEFYNRNGYYEDEE